MAGNVGPDAIELPRAQATQHPDAPVALWSGCARQVENHHLPEQGQATRAAPQRCNGARRQIVVRGGARNRGQSTEFSAEGHEQSTRRGAPHQNHCSEVSSSGSLGAS